MFSHDRGELKNDDARSADYPLKSTKFTSYGGKRYNKTNSRAINIHHLAFSWTQSFLEVDHLAFFGGGGGGGGVGDWVWLRLFPPQTSGDITFFSDI